MRRIFAVTMIAVGCLSIGVPVRGQAEKIAPSPLSAEGNTFKGVLHVPRGDSLWINTRQTYDPLDRPIVMLSVPGDYPEPTCTVEFDYTVLADDFGLGRVYHWRVVPPARVFLTGYIYDKMEILPQKRNEILYAEHPMGTFKPVVIKPQFSVYDQPQRIALCEWGITYTDSPVQDKVTLEVWMNPDQDIMLKSLFTRADFSKPYAPQYFPIGWKKSG